MRLTLLSPGDATQRTGGYLYNARLVEALRSRGHRVDVLEVEGPWPDGPPANPLPHPPRGDLIVADGLLWTGISPWATTWRDRVVVLAHSLLGVEGGPALGERERLALQGVRIVATGGPTRRGLAAMGLPSTLLVPGTHPAPRTQRPRRNHLVALCTLTPRKRIPALLDAVRGLREPWSLTIAGATDRDPDEHQRVLRAMAGLEHRVTLAGELDDAGVSGLLAEADLLVHHAAYEAWGMALSEAMARGVPVLSTPAGALEGGGGAVVNASAFQATLQTLLDDPDALDRLADRAWTAGQALPRWADVAAGLEALAGQ